MGRNSKICVEEIQGLWVLLVMIVRACMICNVWKVQSSQVGVNFGVVRHDWVLLVTAMCIECMVTTFDDSL